MDKKYGCTQQFTLSLHVKILIVQQHQADQQPPPTSPPSLEPSVTGGGHLGSMGQGPKVEGGLAGRTGSTRCARGTSLLLNNTPIAISLLLFVEFSICNHGFSPKPCVQEN